MLLTVTQKLLEGFGTSCIIFIVTLLAALPLGLVIAFGSMSRFKPIAWLTRGFVWIMRGAPLMLQLMIVYYGLGLLWEGNSVSKLSAVLIAFSINYAAYFSEIYRGGIESIPRGQYEAGQVLGMTRKQVFFNGKRDDDTGKGYLPCPRYRMQGDNNDSAGVHVGKRPHMAAVLLGAVLSVILRSADSDPWPRRKETGLFQGVSLCRCWK